MRFAQPEYLYLLLMLPLWLVAYFLYLRRRKRKLSRLGDAEQLFRLLPEVSTLRRNATHVLLIVVAILSIFMLARPQYGAKETTQTRETVQIMIVLDVSRSMLAQDIAPSRLEKTKMMLSRLFAQWEDNQIGLVLFAGDAYTQTPLTADRASASMLLQDVSSDLISHQGTNIAKAINQALNGFPENTKGQGQCIILLTDGEDMSDERVQALQAAATAAKQNIPIHVVAVGTQEGGTIPDPIHGEAYKDANGEVVITRPNEALCKELSQVGKGVFAWLDNSNRAYNTLREAVDEMQKRSITTKRYEEWGELFPFIAGFILLLLFTSALLSFIFPRRGIGKVAWRKAKAAKAATASTTEKETAKKIAVEEKAKTVEKATNTKASNAAKTVLLLFLIGASTMALQAQEQSIRMGNRSYRAEDYKAAENYYRKALETNSKNVEALYNLGNALVMQGRDKDGMEQGYAPALKEAKTPRQKAAIYHNMGDLYMASRHYERAVEAFKNSLRNDPKSDETRYNLALAQKLLNDQKPAFPELPPQEVNLQPVHEEQRSQTPPNPNKLDDSTVEQLLRASEQDERRLRNNLKQPSTPQSKGNKDW